MPLQKSIAEAYFTDARDFAGRFDHLWEALPHKSSRIKSMVDLLFCIECILKCRAFLHCREGDEETLYRSIRKCAHVLERLVEFAAPNDGLRQLVNDVSHFPVGLRYTLDADDTFFNIMRWEGDSPDLYGHTIGNHAWVMGIRRRIEVEIDAVRPSFEGVVDGDWLDIFADDQQLKDFMDKIRSGK